MPDVVGLAVAIVGVGPRGLAVLERLIAGERAAPGPRTVTVHVVDPFPPGAGRVWRTDQSPHLLMNTVAAQVTAYTDDSVTIAGPVEPGPSLYDWARRREAGPDPDTYPPRALYGRYLVDVFARVTARAPAHVRVRVHRARAVALDGDAGPQDLALDDGRRLTGLDAVVLCQGHVGTSPTSAEGDLAHRAREAGLWHVPPANPADVDLSEVAPGETVLLRGLGLAFFDHMALLTEGRGGVYERSDGRLVYRPSGDEPRLVAGSRRGVPHRARGRNQKGTSGRHVPRVVTPARIAELRRRVGGPLRFRADLWPLIAREVEAVHYAALLTGRGRDGAALADAYTAASTRAARDALLAGAGIAGTDRWDWARVARPHEGRVFADRADHRAWLLDHLRRDVRTARGGNVDDPVKAALDALRDIRNEVRVAVDHRGLAGSSHRDELYGWFTPLNAFLSIGPPPSRVEEMIALIEAGVLDVLGPEARVDVDPAAGVFAAGSRLGERVTSRVLVEARLPEPDLRRTNDPLLRYLLATGACAPHRVPDPDGPAHETGGLDVTERPQRLVDARGRVHPRRFALGVPTEAVRWATAVGIRPGTDSVTLADADAVARAVLALAPVGGSDLLPGTRVREAVR
ncbi:FAD/NAD(P)-binding protein [Nocardiopsis lambiniae]|uniref:FAD/NAD(P)-binding protein n=1 Tax=Nocardiopsis lambiniae TaxID=3075539 RepID=A0ABU2M6N1_9ACTN|nr:FAD/NAD(P)-binding protein [Nocardiopsis sp. DSM 44743]MDT0328320.1 FAD/NAD(P)-binding protein [Nocardiopsis sp. DSM 44743]